MPDTTFFRLLKTPIEEKGDALPAIVAAVNERREAEETFMTAPSAFSLIPGSPFAYWATEAVFGIFREFSQFEGKDRTAIVGLQTSDDFRFVRTWWEISERHIGYCTEDTYRNRGWVHFAKGGPYSPFYSDIHLTLNWWRNGKELRAFDHSYIRNEAFYFRPGLTWTPRTQKGLSMRALPGGCVIAHKGPAILSCGDNPDNLLALLAVMNSLLGQMLAELQMAFGSYEIGVIRHIPIPTLVGHTARTSFTPRSNEAHEIRRDRDRCDETSHPFYLPGLVTRQSGSLLEASLGLEAEDKAVQTQLASIQAEIDELVYDLYDLRECDRSLVRAEMSPAYVETSGMEDEDDAAEGQATAPEDLPVRVQNLLMWCIGVSFGRWDVRMAMDRSLLPALQGPFDPLPRCAPGALIGADGLPPSKAAEIAPEPWLRARENVLDLPPSGVYAGQDPAYPLPIAWDGILVDDPGHPADIVARVRGVLTLLWGEQAGEIEREACDILGFKTLRDYFRDPRKGFFPFHIKRYSKSRRKAPIYWLLQSANRGYGIWLYIHRMDKSALYTAAREYADPKVALEEARMGDLRAGLEALSVAARRGREREIERQTKLVEEVTAFCDELDRLALLNLPPDLNDGVVIGIAPLHTLVPWKEGDKMWNELVSGKYEWSTMSQQMRKRGLVKE